ncbi:uncharacterized protein LOC126846831 [Adelges cooleyi]|uniref:uncharacterized protein LOC126846831 n=1 Tax=Adelges cooleyi TaxID=133065 RepID=UPI0021805944|nr:uncharacterized protein LOC126846831 [Adelges cooleyi]XP_050442597.1 uncharacterized protein LOC126846831 [Adelges cooleyi]
MNGFTSLVCMVALGCACVNGQVPSSTPCSLSFYRYLYNLPGEKIRPNVPAGTYVFGKRVGPPQEDAEASDNRPSFLKPDSREYLPPSVPSTTFLPPQPVSTTTYRPPPPPPPPVYSTQAPSTSAPVYIPPPPSPYFPEASNTVAVKSVKPADCDSPSHRAAAPPQLPAALPRFDLPKLPQPTFFAPQFAFPQQPPRPVVIAANEIRPPQFKYPVPTPPSRSLASKPAEECDKPHHPITPFPLVPSTTITPSTTAAAAEPLETRQDDVVIIPSSLQTLDQPKPDCGHPEHQPAESQGYGQQSIGVPSEDYGVSAAPSVLQPAAPSAGYSYDKPSPSFGYPQLDSGYNYPKPSPSFDFPGFSGQATSLFESPAAQSSIAKEDGDLVILKV